MGIYTQRTHIRGMRGVRHCLELHSHAHGRTKMGCTGAVKLSIYAYAGVYHIYSRALRLAPSPALKTYLLRPHIYKYTCLSWLWRIYTLIIHVPLTIPTRQLQVLCTPYNEKITHSNDNF